MKFEHIAIILTKLQITKGYKREKKLNMIIFFFIFCDNSNTNLIQTYLT